MTESFCSVDPREEEGSEIPFFPPQTLHNPPGSRLLPRQRAAAPSAPSPGSPRWLPQQEPPHPRPLPPPPPPFGLLRPGEPGSGSAPLPRTLRLTAGSSMAAARPPRDSRRRGRLPVGPGPGPPRGGQRGGSSRDAASPQPPGPPCNRPHHPYGPSAIGKAPAIELLCRVWREVEAWALPRTAPSVTRTGILEGTPGMY